MTHEDAGHYASKHGSRNKPDLKITEAIKGEISDGRITCAAMHKISKELGVVPSETGKNADLLEVRLIQCRLGLFGYAPKKKIVKPAKEISQEMSMAIRESITDNRISCLSCWKIAERLGRSKMDVSAACDKLNIKISPCQLGAF